MTQLLHRFRGLAIALAVLAISAGAVFAAAPHFTPTSAPVAESEETAEPTAEPTQSPDEDADEDEDAPEATETPEAPEPTEGTEDGTAADSHGTMVSAAAQMETPEGFANHGAFVSCVAHLDELVDPATVTLEMCAAADGAKGAEKAAEGKAKGAEKAAEGKAKGAAKKAAGQAHGHGRPTGS